MADFIDSMRLRSVDLLGHGQGAAIAAELAAQRPQQIRRVVLVAMPDAGNPAVLKPLAPVAARVAAAPKSAFGRLAAVDQMTLLIYPGDAGSKPPRADSLLPQHSTLALPATVDALYGAQVSDLAAALRSFVDA